MEANVRFLRRLYGLLLMFYPQNYREEFGRELQAVFDLSLEEAATKRGFEVARLVFRELVHLPQAILYEHLRERRRVKMAGNFASRFNFAPGSRHEVWAALIPFLLFGALPTLLGYFRVSDFVPLWLDIGFVVVLWSLGLCLFVIGFVKRFPRWFMPYVGLPMPIVSLLLFNSAMDILQGVWWYKLPWFLSEFLQQGLLWIGLFFIVILLPVVTGFIPKSRPFYERLRDDWTLLSFMIYGVMPLALVFTLNEYKNEEPYMLVALLILAAGGWLYLRSDEPSERFLYLHLGMSLSILTAAVGKAFLLKSSFPWALEVTWQSEFMSTVISWIWVAMLMMVPYMLSLLSRSDSPPRVA